MRATSPHDGRAHGRERADHTGARPWQCAGSIVVPALRAFGSEKVTIEHARPSELTARRSDGDELHLAFDRWVHPNARLGVEPDGAAAFVRFERRGEPPEGPYRSIRPGAARLILIETDGERALRRERIALTAVGTALRLGVLVMALA